MTTDDLAMPLALHPLTYLDEGAEVTVGRADIDSYAVLPADGAALLRELERGVAPAQAAAWYEQRYGQQVDMDDFVAVLVELDFLSDGTTAAAAGPVRWQRLGRALFSRPAWVLYAALLTAAAAAMVRRPELAPHYRNLFFTEYVTVLELVLFLGQFPLLLIHESFHALAGRRLGLRSRLGIGRRLYFVVLETSMDGLVAVPRRQRYLPMLAGMLADLLVIAVLTLTAALLRDPAGGYPLAARICLTLAFGTALRFTWQFYLYLRTDLYYVVVTVLGCVDLHGTARQLVLNRLHRLRRRPDRVVDETTFHPRDRAVARWYQWLFTGGYAVSIAILALAVVPTTLRILHTVFGRLTGATAAGAAGLADSMLFIVLNGGQFILLCWLIRRGRRANSRERT